MNVCLQCVQAQTATESQIFSPWLTMFFYQLSATSTGHTLQCFIQEGLIEPFPPTTLVVSNHHQNAYLLRLITLNEH
jgi:hypothetical protein